MDFSKSEKLIKELKTGKFLPYFNEELFQQIIYEYVQIQHPSLKEIFGRVQNDLRDPYYDSRIFTIHQCMQRNKRALLLYLQLIFLCKESSYWEFGSNIPKECKEYLKLEEIQYTNKYKENIQNYSEQLTQKYGFDLDLIKDLEPPNDRYIEVRVLQECGEIITSDGDILKLSLNSFHFVKRSDVENLILQGFLQPQ